MNRRERLEEVEAKLSQVEDEIREDEWMEGFEDVLRTYEGEDEVISFQEYQRIVDEDSESSWRVNSLLPTLDDMTEGFGGGDLVTITAPTAHGKTTFAQTLTKNYAKINIPSLWFTYEVPVYQFLRKFGDDVPVGYVPKEYVSKKLVWIERKIVESIVKYDTKVVFIDHLHYLMDFSKSRSASLKIGEVCRELKRISKCYNIVIVLIAHMAKTRFEDRIGLDDIRDSSFIAQESDFVIILRRLSDPDQTRRDIRVHGIDYIDKTSLFIEKNRWNGKTGSLTLNFKDGLFYEKGTG